MQSYSSAAAERRLGTRWPASRARFSLWSPKLNLQPELVDFNSQGLAFRVPTSTSIEKGSRIALVLQTQQTIPFAHIIARAGSVLREGSKLRVGGPIEDFAAARQAGLWVASAGDLVRVRDDARRHEIITSIRKHPTRATLTWSAGQQVHVSTRVTSTEAALDSVHFELPSEIDIKSELTARLLFSIYGACFALDGILSRDPWGHAYLAPPFELLSLSRRRSDRVMLRADQAVVRWKHPLDPTREIIAAAHDLSAGGVGVVAPASTTPFPPADRCSMTLEIEGERVELEGELMHVSPEGRHLRFGFRTATTDSHSTIRVAHLCRAVRFPELSSRVTAVPQAVDDLFRESGYLELCKDLSPPTEWYQPVEDERVGLDTVHRRADGRLNGHLSCLRVYGRTWMYHQLATVGQSKEARLCRRALYLDTANFVSFLGGDTWYSLAYFDRAKSWHKLLFGSFVEWVGSESLATLVALDRFECKEAGSESTAPVPRTKMSVGRLTGSEASQATALVSRTLPGLAVEAMDMTESLIAQNLRCADLYALSGRERGRHSLALRLGGKLVGLALCDIGSRGLSLFNLLNMAFVFFEADVDPDVQTAFLEHVKSFYSHRGIGDPIIVSPPATLTSPESAGLVLAETMGAIVISAEGFKQYRNFLNFFLSRHARVEPSRPDQRPVQDMPGCF